MDGGDNTKQPHRCKQQGAERAKLAAREFWREQCHDGESAHDRYAAKVDELPARVALEDVVDGREERGDDHGGDASVVYAEEHEV